MGVVTRVGISLLARLGALVLRAVECHVACTLVLYPPDADGVVHREVLPELPRPLGWG